METGIMEPKTGIGCESGKDKPALGDQSGFTLIEVLIAVCILAIGVMGVCSMQIFGLKGNTASRQYTDYATLAMERMEILMAMPYANLPTDGANNGNTADGVDGLFVTNATADRVIPDTNGQYTMYINVAPNYLYANTTTVSVTVVWNTNSFGMTQRSFSLQGVIPQVT